MLPELGSFCLILAFSLSLLQLVIFPSKISAINVIRPLAFGQVFFVIIAFVLLLLALLSDDFSVLYVVQNSNSSLPWYYKFTALWGAHEGSLLLWIMILNCWILALAIASRQWSLTFTNALLTVLGFINLGFLWLIISSSNPFARIFQDIPLDGMDLNPLLQDFGMIIHPPLLYIGYVGCSVGFAFAIAALLSGQLDQAWAQKLRPWVLIAWLFLTLGIAIGSWWAYYELGWGGWWFWDPVENASFMPWLTTTALLHCLAIGCKQSQFLLWAVFLCIVTFALSLLGTFLVRSGSITSVHAFAADPQRGIFILQFLAVTVGCSLLLYSIRAPKLRLLHHRTSRLAQNSVLILSNNIILLVATATVLLGTLYPLIYDFLFDARISVGYPYFNAVFIPIMLLLFILMLPATISNKKLLLIIILCSTAVATLFLYLWFGVVHLNAVMGLSLAFSIIVSCFKAKKLAMALAHLGVATTIIGISLTPIYEVEKNLRLGVGETVAIADYNINFVSVAAVDGPNYFGYKAGFAINKKLRNLATIFPEKRIYLAREQPTTETAILPGVLQDIYIALGQQLDAATWSVRIYYKPFVRWIWIGAILMASGALYGLLVRKN